MNCRRRPKLPIVTPGILAAGALVFAALALSAPAAIGSEELENGGFESWGANGKPSGWVTINGGQVSQTSDAVNGSAALVTAGRLAQPVELTSGDSVTLTAMLKPAGGPARLELAVLNAEFEEIALIAGTEVPQSGTFVPATLVTQLNHPSATYGRFRVGPLTAGGTVTIDNASLDRVQAPPTSTPTPTPTPTPTDTPTPTATPGDDDEPTPTAVPGSSATATRTPTKTPTPTKTETPTRTPTGTRTPSPTREATSTRAPSTPQPGAPTAPLSTSTPTLPASSGFGGLLANGDFELVSGGKPAYWGKFGGELTTSSDSARGAYAGCLVSETSSTKWMYQVVSIDDGGWYRATARARVSGGGQASIRVSWYASDDGSGSQMSQSESNLVAGSGWASLDSGAVQAPAGANSARVRLTFQPSGAATACWDDATFSATSEPEPTPAPQPILPVAPSSASTATPSRTAAAGSPTRPPVPGAAGSRPATGPAIGAAVPSGTGLRISEVMSDPPPSGRDAEFEWVELVNVSSEAIDLAGWKLADGNAETPLPAGIIPPGGYVVVAGSGVSLPAGVLVVVSPSGQLGNGLGNDGDLLRLFAPNGELVDELSYGDNTKVFDPSPDAPGAGETLGVRDPAADPASENWAITLRPSPGEPNVFPPKPQSTVAGVRTAAPGGGSDAAGDDALATFTDDGGGDGDSPSLAPWLIFGGILGVSLFLAGGVVGPRLQERLKKRG